MTFSTRFHSRIAGLAMAVSVIATFSVFVIPLNRYNWDGRSAMTPDADDVLAIVLFSAIGLLAGVIAAWAARTSSRRVRVTILAVAGVMAVYDIMRLLQAIPHYQG
ncbi:MAG TPA: hypothetical protein VF911_07640 [Thermoanaerobaculia bacterium]